MWTRVGATTSRKTKDVKSKGTKGQMEVAGYSGLRDNPSRSTEMGPPTPRSRTDVKR